MAVRPPFLFALGLAGYALAVDGGRVWSAALDRAYNTPGYGQQVEDLSSHRMQKRSNAYQRIRPVGPNYFVEYGFTNHNGDNLAMSVKYPQTLVQAAWDEFGVSKYLLQALDVWYENTQKASIKKAESQQMNGRITANSQAELAAKLRQAETFNKQIQDGLKVELDGIQQEYKKRKADIYADAGFRMADVKTFEPDVPKLVQRNNPRMNVVAAYFQEQASLHGYGMEELVSAVVAMAQTAIIYKVPPDVMDNKLTGGIVPPPKIFAQGWGDCDTKTTLTLSILSHWNTVKLVGVAIPEHYLMGWQRAPDAGEAYVEYQGETYVLVEPTGPAWLPPGHVGEETTHFLKSGRDFEIQPLQG